MYMCNTCLGLVSGFHHCGKMLDEKERLQRKDLEISGDGKFTSLGVCGEGEHFSKECIMK